MQAYKIELIKGPLEQKHGAHTICADFEQIYYNEHGKQIKLSHSTLIRLASGGIAKSQSNAQRSWHGRAVNPSTNEAWWSLLQEMITKYEVKQHNMYGVDEMGCQPQGGEREHVFGRKKNGPQYQQRGGNRENVTVIVTICTDGTATSPSVIFKGSAFHVKWNQENPANAS
jgi:hypothetical protein